jgi:transmembrane sensor
MKNDIPWDLLDQIFKENYSKRNSNDLNIWINSSSENKIIFDQLKNHYELTGRLPVTFNPDTTGALIKISKNISLQKKRFNDTNKALAAISKIAAFVLLGLFSFWLVYSLKENKSQNFTTITTNDSTLQYTLSDGSRVWLNRHSKIRFGHDFKRQRNIFLIGEAYFEVAHDKQHPFKVFADKSITTVVGTKFNIRSWITESQIELTVTEGKVLFGTKKGNEIALSKGQTGVLTKCNNVLSTNEQSDCNKESWRTRDFYFENQTFEKVLIQLSEAYNFHFKIEDISLRTCPLTAKFHQRPLPEIIKTLEAVTNSKILISNNIYIIKK